MKFLSKPTTSPAPIDRRATAAALAALEQRAEREALAVAAREAEAAARVTALREEYAPRLATAEQALATAQVERAHASAVASIERDRLVSVLERSAPPEIAAFLAELDAYEVALKQALSVDHQHGLGRNPVTLIRFRSVNTNAEAINAMQRRVHHMRREALALKRQAINDDELKQRLDAFRTELTEPRLLPAKEVFAPPLTPREPSAVTSLHGS